MQRAGGFSSLVRAFRLYLQVEGLRPQTVSHYCRDVERLARRFPERNPSSLAANDIREYVRELTETLAPKTVREAQLALRRFFRFLTAEGEINANPVGDMKLMNFRVTPQPTYSEAEVKKLLLVCDASSSEGVRDAALITVLFDTGVREGELVSMGVPISSGGASSCQARQGRGWFPSASPPYRRRTICAALAH